MTLKRVIELDSYYHVYNRSIEKRQIFYSDHDYQRFVDRMEFYKIKYEIKILCYSILPNHFHFLIKTPRVANPRGSLSKFMGDLLNTYAKYFNTKYERVGSLWQGRYKAKIIADENYLQSVIDYIINNPVKHEIVDDIKDWKYMSKNLK